MWLPANRILPPGPQAPSPDPVMLSGGTDPRITGLPPSISIFHTRSSRTNPMELLSGDQNGKRALSVSGSSVASNLEKSLTQSLFFELQTAFRPSGEMEGRRLRSALTPAAARSNRRLV